MSIKIFISIFFIFISNFYSYSTCYDDNECLIDLVDCLRTNYTIQEFAVTNNICCEKTLNESDDVWFQEFYDCFEELHDSIVINCFPEEEDECREQIGQMITVMEDNFAEFQNKIISRIQRPTTFDECGDSFFLSLTKAVSEQCKETTDKFMHYICSFYEEI